MATMNISLPEPMREWVRRRIDSGQFASANDYVRDLIRRDQAEADARETLVSALIDGEESGLSNKNVLDILSALRSELHRADA